MARLAQIACAATVILTASAIPLRADPINILSGSVFIPTAPNIGDLSIVGTQGFSVTGRVAGGGLAGTQGLFAQCTMPECTPGTRIEFDVGLSGASGSLGGAMTIAGDHYEISDSVNALADVFLLFDGSIIAPAAGAAQVILSAPFSLTGRALAATPLGAIAHNDELFGGGVGTVTLVPFPAEAGFPPSWMVQSVRFDFAQPTPEPSTLLLLGTCAVAAVRRRTSA
jgi:hypothetical protein